MSSLKSSIRNSTFKSISEYFFKTYFVTSLLFFLDLIPYSRPDIPAFAEKSKK